MNNHKKTIPEKGTPHESAAKHVSGESIYVDDIPATDQLLTGQLQFSAQ